MSDDNVLKFPSIVPNGQYRIRNAGRSSPNLYLEWRSDTSITPEELEKDNTKQQWTITSAEPDIYTIVNVHSKSPLSIITYVEGGETKYRLGAGGSQQWTVEPRGSQWVIGVLDNGRVVDLADNNTPILWERNNHVNQHWVLEIVDVDHSGDGGSSLIAPGVYNITNVATKGDVLPYINREGPNVTPSTWPTDLGWDDRKWIIVPAQGGVEIMFGRIPVNTIRWLGEGPEVTQKLNVCRLVLVPNTQYFRIALSTKTDARYLADLNAVGTANLPSSSVVFDANDQRQQWYFTPYRPSNWPSQ